MITPIQMTTIQPSSVTIVVGGQPRITIYPVETWICDHLIKVTGHLYMMCNTFGVAIPVEISKKDVGSIIHKEYPSPPLQIP